MLSPSPEQARRELDRRNGRRTWPKCRGPWWHRLAARRLRRWSDNEIRTFLYESGCRLEPPMWARECRCGVDLP